jgi:type IV pilus assembly protein PilM
MGENFCGTCGEDLTLALRKAVEQFEGILEEARLLYAQYRHDEAIKLLSNVLSAERSQAVSDQAVQAKRFLEEVVNDRDLRKAAADRILAESQTLVAAHRYADALERLQSVPDAFRSPALRELIVESEARQAEIARLESGLVDSRVRAKPSQLLVTVRRFLEIQPDHPGALKLAQTLATQLYQLAREQLARHRYAEALRLLDEIPPAVRSEAVARARERVEEAAWLDREVRTTPVIDAALPGIVARLQRMSPRDPTAARAAKEIAHRLEVAARSEQPTVPPWAKSPPQSPWGAPVEWLTGFRHISVKGVRHEPMFAERPGCYYVACGLALQGLGQSQLQTNLRPADSRNVLVRMANMNIMPRRARTAWGIDVGSTGIKAVCLAWTEEGRIAIQRCHSVEHRRLLGETFDEADWQQCIEQSLRSLQGHHNLKGDRVCVAVPGTTVLHRTLRLPPMPPDKIEAAVQLELKQMSTQSRQKLVGTYHVQEADPGNPNHSRRGHDVVLLVGRNDRLAALLQTFQKVGVDVELMQSDCLALHNYMSYDHLLQPTATPGKEKAVALLDMGGNLTNVLVSSPHVIWNSTVSMGADQFTKSLVNEFDITHAEAEQLKRQPFKASRMARWHSALAPVFEDFAQELTTALDAFSRIHPDVTLDRIGGVGGGFLLHGLVSYLQRGA